MCGLVFGSVTRSSPPEDAFLCVHEAGCACGRSEETQTAEVRKGGFMVVKKGLPAVWPQPAV